MEKTNFTRFIAHILEEYRLEQELVITSVLPTEALYVQMDPTQMNRVITNLIQNSIKFADPTKEQLAFTISLTHNQTDLVLTITDNGIGIDKKNYLIYSNASIVQTNLEPQQLKEAAWD